MVPGYESWFLSARSPDGTRGVWLRRTVHRSPGRPPQVADWCTLFTSASAGVVKQIHAGDVGRSGSEAGPTAFRGQARTAAASRSWQVRIAAPDSPLRPLRPAALYLLPFPRTKVEVPVPLGLAAGRIESGEGTWQLSGWPATVGHNWGVEHADRWIWLHAAALGPLRWLDLVLARARIGSGLTPWLAAGGAGTASGRVLLGGLRRRPVVEAAAAGGVELRLPTSAGELAISVHAGQARTVGVTYRDPRHGSRQVAHTGLARARLELTGHDGSPRISASGVAALEVATSDSWHGLPITDLPLEDG